MQSLGLCLYEEQENYVYASKCHCTFPENQRGCHNDNYYYYICEVHSLIHNFKILKLHPCLSAPVRSIFDRIICV